MASLAAIITANTGVSADQLGSIEKDRPEYLRRAASLFMRIDANSDGVLNRSELNALVGEKKAEFMMGDLDVDHDGKIDPSEWSTYWVKCSSAGVNVDKRLNWIEQQVVSLEQGRAASKKKASLRCCSATDIPEIMKRATSIFLEIDVDQSGSLEREELLQILGTTERVTPALQELDSDKDGHVSIAEFCQWAIRMYVDHDKDFSLDHLHYLEVCVSRMRASKQGESKVDSAASSSKISLKQASAIAIPDILRRATSAFLRLDLNGDGALDRGEIKTFADGNESVAKQMFVDLDANNDGKISNIEWQKYFIEKYNTKGGELTLQALAVIENKLAAADL